MDNLNAAIAHLFADHNADLTQAADTSSSEAQQRLHDLEDALVIAALAANFTKAASRQYFLQYAKRLVDEAYADIIQTAESNVQPLADLEYQFVSSTINRTANQQLIVPAKVNAVSPSFGGMPLASWFLAQAREMLRKLGNAATQLQTAAKDVTALDPSLVSNTIRTSTRISYNYADSLIQSAVARTSSDVRTSVLKFNSKTVQGFMVLATLDSKVCAQCLAYHGATYDLDYAPLNESPPFNGGPPFHMNCRCLLTPYFYPVAGFSTAIPDPLSTEDWLDNKTEAQLDKLLGKGRAQLFRDGKITVRDLISGSGRQVRLADLKTKYE